MSLKNRHVISMKDFSREEIDHILDTAERLEPVARGEEKLKLLDGKIIALLFFEPSTRTRMSFEAAVQRLGGKILNLGSVEASSVMKGENLADTIRVISNYADLIVLRHPLDGSARMAAEFSSVPIINGGDGSVNHPTQTFLDLYTIRRESHLEGLKIALAGDLKYGRTVHSLCYALSLYEAEMIFVSPPELRMPPEIVRDLQKRNINVKETDSLEKIIGDVEVLYMTRVQRERFPDPEEYEKVKNRLKVTGDLLRNVNPNLKILHPLPRVNEISPEVDSTPYACYFEQAFYGVPTRMALLALATGVIE
ncbi:aspartate carbamoyltransferase [Methanosarcina thermophila]|jgi:aspartate carbamoyltransferase catalytic subunit|uniref:Aspartate carbamoyltransferase n=3 Tax=Methanosarcina thermophila TaxID=2210 RepID=A0A1I6X2Z9_METTE|nr:aspartate carbamoyltransferase [Methanosarcina thermophila]NLU57438.1 aspartate carbamoyltransferase [Methanosarcina thermophila]SFT32620.1 aspartate carbamoyltransferase [Methanosarcina thermophila]GLI12893.1 aspartate carbamoyltransferase [Methanosarcina thermophila MST-A1]HOQ64632.1 aspartate carbamoyltransferase [Methanosarcina thermophila]HPT79864.1 aspartate carbamoyltransferase [Methanosarcina thermophila]